VRDGVAAAANGGEPLNKSDACRTQPQKNCIYLSSLTDFYAPWRYDQSRYHHQSTFVDNEKWQQQDWKDTSG